jgi:hypothetical protein
MLGPVEKTGQEYTEPASPLDALLPKNVAPGGVSGCFELNPI